jgi:AraC-like DNA-binding protein
VVTYREFAPAPALRGLVRSYFSFLPGWVSSRGRRAITREVEFRREESFCAPQFADGHVSLVFELGATCHVGRGWTSGAPVRGRALGALRTVGDAAGSVRSEMIGVYLEPGSAPALLQVPAVELTDQALDLASVWGTGATGLTEELLALDESARVDRLEGALLERLRRTPMTPRSSVDCQGLARWVRAESSTMTVHRLADAAGVSRRHLARVFRNVVGVSPKRYCRLARFQAGLVYAGAGPGVRWAQVAAELGYADQSHMIAEFQELGGLTPEALVTRRWFHPFILDARCRLARRPAT